MTKIYTRGGDQGNTSLYSGERVPKNDIHIDAVGNVDECNSCLGVALSLMSTEEDLALLRKRLEEIQGTLFEVGAAIATPRTSASQRKLDRTNVALSRVKDLESWIDEMEGSLEPLKQFILPSGTPAACALHLARNVARRAERSVTVLFIESDVDSVVQAYMNRLSDFLFVASRFVNAKIGVQETVWSSSSS